MNGKPTFIGSALTARRARIIRELIGDNRIILEYGSGAGELSKILSFRNRVSACEATVQPTIYPTQYYDGGHLPYADESFDAVVSCAVLEHVQNERESLDEMRRVLARAGDLVLTLPNRWWIFEVHYPFPFNRIPLLSWLPQIPLLSRARIYTKNGIERLLSSVGFKVLQMCYMTAPMDKTPFLWRVFQEDTTSIPFRATEIIVHARRHNVQFSGSDEHSNKTIRNDRGVALSGDICLSTAGF